MTDPDGTGDRGARGRLDFTSGAVLALLSLVALFWLIPGYVSGEGQNGGFAPATFPMIAAATVLALSLALMAVNRHHVFARLDGAGRDLMIELGAWSAFAVVLFAIVARAGFVAAGIFGILAGVWLSLYRRNLPLAVLVAVGLPVAIDWGVWWIFSVDLP